VQFDLFNVVPTGVPMQLADTALDQIFRTAQEKYDAIRAGNRMRRLTIKFMRPPPFTYRDVKPQPAASSIQRGRKCRGRDRDNLVLAVVSQ